MGKRFQLALGFVSLAAAVVAGVYSIIWFVSAFSQTESAVQAAIVAGLFAVFSLIFTYVRERQKSINEAHREQKIKLYESFGAVVFDNLDKYANAASPEDLIEDAAFQAEWKRIRKGVVFYGSPAVLSALGEFTKRASLEADSTVSMRRMGRIILAMRADLGLSNRGLNELNIHQVYVSDDLTTLGMPK